MREESRRQIQPESRCQSHTAVEFYMHRFKTGRNSCISKLHSWALSGKSPRSDSQSPFEDNVQDTIDSLVTSK